MVGRLLPVDGAVREELVDELQAAIGDAYAIERELGGDGMSRRYVTHRDGRNIRVIPNGSAQAMTTALRW